MPNTQKDTIYIDIDDEITSIIDKFRGSPQKIVALVLPKRATVLQSVVNMKLLKRTADETKKHVVLITSEAALMPLAGAVGLHVARTLQSHPAIPSIPKPEATPPSSDAEPQLDPHAPVGALAGTDEEDTIEVDNSDDATSPGKDKKPKKDKAGGKKKLKVPNFERFRTRLLLGGAALVLLVIGWVVGFMVLPKATITLKTDTTNLDTNLTFTADTNVKEFQAESAVLPAVSKEFRKTDNEKVPATGQKDVGNKATGTVSLKNCTRTDGSVEIPAGTGVTANNLTFITQSAVSLPASQFTGGGSCITAPADVAITAKDAGEQFNIGSGQTFTVAGYSSVSGSNGSATSGGTTKMVKIVSQQDIDTAKQRITDRTATEAPKDLQEELREEQYFALTDTLTPGNPAFTSSPEVGQEAAEVTVTSTATFTMVGVKEDDLKKLIENDAKKKIDEQKQMIQDNGLNKATLRTQKKAGSQVTLSLQTVVVAGPELDAEAIRQEVAGKRRGEAAEIVRKRPGIKDVEIAYSPFWVQSTPKKATKIQIVFEQADDQSTQP